MKFDNIGRLQLFMMDLYCSKISLDTIISLSQVKNWEGVTVDMDTKK